MKPTQEKIFMYTEQEVYIIYCLTWHFCITSVKPLLSLYFFTTLSLVSFFTRDAFSIAFFFVKPQCSTEKVGHKPPFQKRKIFTIREVSVDGVFLKYVSRINTSAKPSRDSTLQKIKLRKHIVWWKEMLQQWFPFWKKYGIIRYCNAAIVTTAGKNLVKSCDTQRVQLSVSVHTFHLQFYHNWSCNVAMGDGFKNNYYYR